MVDRTRKEVFEFQEYIDEGVMFDGKTFGELVSGIESFEKELKAKYQKKKFGPYHFRWNVASGYDYMSLGVNVYRFETDKEMTERIEAEEEMEAEKIRLKRLRDEKKLAKLKKELEEDTEAELKLLAALKAKYESA
jgi:hypothetical protein